MNAERVALEEARRILDTPLYADLGGDAEVSFEFFPPKTEKMEEQLWDSIDALAPLAPRFVSVTYGAGGSTRERTHNTVARIARETKLPAAAHLTCVDASKAEIAESRRRLLGGGRAPYRRAARRSAGAGREVRAAPGGLCQRRRAGRGLKALHDFEISVAAYPETHPEALSAASRSRQPEAQARCGRDPRDHAILLRRRTPISALSTRPRRRASRGDPARHHARHQLRRRPAMSAMCNTEVPSWMARLFEGLDEHPGARQLVAATVAAELCRRLYAGGVRISISTH
jgi:methylenetetrahydrofolate reductase (NADPH)